MCFGVCREGVSADGGVWAKAPLSPSLEAAGSGYLWEVHVWCLVSPESTELHPALGQRVVLAFQRSANFVFPACCQLMYFSQLCNYQPRVVLKLACYQPGLVLSEIPVSGIT